MPAALIVFYGSLMEGLTLAGKPDLAALGARCLSPCAFPGVLWDTGRGHPALTGLGATDAGTVHGELWELADRDAALPPLDAFEGLYDGDDDASAYLRRRVVCDDPAGVEAWIYLWNGPTSGFARLPGGSWRDAAPPEVRTP